MLVLDFSYRVIFPMSIKEANLRGLHTMKLPDLKKKKKTETQIAGNSHYKTMVEVGLF